MLYIFLIVYIIFFILNSYVYKKKINLPNVIITLWVLSSVLSMFGFYDMFVPGNTTYTYILFFIISLELFSILFYKVLFKKIYKPREPKKDYESEKINFKILNIILFVLIIIMIIFVFPSLKLLISGGSFSDIRDAYLNCENFSNKLQMFISLVLFPLGDAIGIYAIIQYVQKKKISYTLVLYLIFMAEVILYTGGRGKLVYIVIIMICALMDKYKNNVIRIIKENKAVMIAMGIIAIVVTIITLQRNLQGKGLIYNIYCYFAGNINLLGVYLNDPERFLLTTDNLLYGQILISGFSYPIIFLLEILGLDIKAGLYIAYEVTQSFIPISPNTTINNSVTAIYFALRDFGILGVFIYAAVIAFFFAYIYKRKEENDNLLNKAIYFLFIRCSIFLIFDFNFANTGNILTFIYLILLYIICVEKKGVNGDKCLFMSKILGYIKKPQYILFLLDRKRIITLKDETYLKIMYEKTLKKQLNLESPKTFNEKLQWLKLYDRNPKYIKMVDKYEVKEYISKVIGKEYVIPTLGIYENFEDIDFAKLPNKFIIKGTHDSGSTVICKDKKSFDYEEAKRKINKFTKQNYFYNGREWPYKNVKPRIIIEKYMEDPKDEVLRDYKFMCFNGKVKCSFVCSDRYTDEGLKVTFFDVDWNKLPFERHYPSSNKEISRPVNYELMIELSEKLAKDIPFVRVDWYEIDGKVYFGELTFYPGNGLEEFTPEEYDEILGSWIELPSVRK